MKQNKRMIYIYDENMDIYDSIENKSEWLNKKLKDLRDNEMSIEAAGTDKAFEDRLRRVRGRDTTDSGTE